MISRMVSMLVAAFVFMLAETASAQRELPIPAEEWTAEARYNLARCLVGEAGWEAPELSHPMGTGSELGRAKASWARTDVRHTGASVLRCASRS